jgi:murein DD-endopeptidase MepM/ murein hydrolase activator NlpD
MNMSHTPGGFRITSKFGAQEPFRTKPHTGVDISMPEGTPLESIDQGVVERILDNDSIGKGVIIRLEDGKEAIYGHMSEVQVEPGHIVDAGEVIGLSGNTGHSTGPHLHLGMKDHGNYIDPLGDLDPHKGILWRVIENGVESGKEGVREGAESLTHEIIAGIFDALKDTVIDMSYAIALIGGGLCIVFKVAGWDGGYKWSGILSVAFVFIRYLLG